MRIIYATDGSEGATAAGRMLAGFQLGADDSLSVLTVVADARNQHAQGVVNGAVELLGASPARIRKVTCYGHPAAEIIRAAEEMPTDLVVVGSQGRSAIAHFLVGSVAEQLARHAPCPVLLVRGGGEAPRRVAVGVDGSDGSQRALDFLMELPIPPSAEIRLVTIIANLHEMAREHLMVTPPLAEHSTPLDQWLRDQALARLTGLVASLGGAGRPVVTEIRSGDAARGLIEVAEDEGTDLIVVGSHGPGVLEQFFLGSVSQQVLSHAPCSVLIVRGKPAN